MWVADDLQEPCNIQSDGYYVITLCIITRKCHIKWPLGRSLLKNRVRRISRWPFPNVIIFYNDRERRCLQSDGEAKCYRQVCLSYAGITPIFLVFCVHFRTIPVIALVFELITSYLMVNC